MGVPKFFRYVSERYPCLSELVRENQVPEFDNLYLDMNGIIHNCSHPNDNDVHFRITEEQIFKDIFFYLETLFNMIKPQKLFFLAVDGVAPRAKQNQQRGRRFRSAKEAEVQEEKARQKGEVLPAEARFDSNCITPGTPFMCRLDKALRYFIQYKISNSKMWRDCKVILSGHQTPGEGEHKIMEYIRYLKSQKKFDPNTRHCLYGLDADLIMLGLCTHERHFSLLREEVKFGKKNNKTVSVDQQRFFLLHLSLMRDYLEQEFIVLKHKLNFPYDIEKIIDDWVFMGFLVGNDFIPHIPNLHIQTNALPFLYDAYIKTLPTLDGYINEGGYLNLSRLQAYIENLAQLDRDNFSATYDDLKFLESKHQAGFDHRNQDTFGGNQDLMDLVRATEFEFDSPDEDEEDDTNAATSLSAEEIAKEKDNLTDEEIFEKEFHQHRRNYYVNKLKYEEMTPEVLMEQTRCYITALQWTLSYYYHGVQSWGYFYPHHYAPFISDIKNFKDFDIIGQFNLGKPFLPFQQLMSVLPAGSKDHVPECYKQLMTSPESELIDFYPTSFETDLNGKKQEWEAVVLIPFIEEDKLLKTLQKYDDILSSDEKVRNVHGPMFVYTYINKSQGTLEAPENFPSIGNLLCKEEKVYREEIQIPKNKLVLGPSKGALTNVYYAGFPTMKHLNYKSELRLQHVKVFDQPSRSDNMVIIVEPRVEFDKPIEVVVKDIMGKVVHVGWPHLMEAKIVRISDKEKTFFSDGNSDKTDPQKWKMDVQSIRDHHINRMGIDIGEVQKLVHVLQATGEEYRYDPKVKIFRTVRTWNRVEAAYPIQCIVTNVKAYRKRMKEELPLLEAYKTGTEVFMITNPYYGSIGEVCNTEGYEKTGRVKVLLTVHQEPDLHDMIELNHKSQESYMNSYHASSKLSISENVFNRITGTVLVVGGMKRQVIEGTSKINIGLQLKFAKQNEELTGYTKKERLWLYSDKVISLVQEYYCKFPQIFEVMENRSNSRNNEIYFESDFFETTDGEDNLHHLLKWINQLPHNKAERRQIGTQAVERELLDAISDEVNKVKDLPIKKITIQVKPHLLYAPLLSKMTTKAPDHSANFEIFDRVFVARESDKYSVGMKGTIVGITHVRDLNPVRQDCINKEDTYCEILFDDSSNGGLKTGRLTIENLINISYGNSLDNNSDGMERGNRTVKKYEKTNANGMTRQHEQPKLTESFSAVLQNTNRDHQNGPQKNQNFVEMWNALKVGGMSAPPPSTHQQSKLSKQEIDSQKNINDVINKKMSEMIIKKKISPTPNDQSVPIMIAPPKKLPTPPLEWLNSEKKMDEPKLKLEMPMRQQPQQHHPHPQHQQVLPPIRHFYPNPSQQFPLQAQHGFPHPIPVYAQRPVRMMGNPQQPIIIGPPPVFFKSNEAPVAPYFSNNQQPFHQNQQQQRYFNNNSNNNNSNNINSRQQQQQGKFKQQQQPMSAPVTTPTNAQQNPFIPLQAARKSTKGKDKEFNHADEAITQSFKEVTQTQEDSLKEVPKTSQENVQSPEIKSESVSAPITEVKKEVQTVVDTRKSRLAIKF